MRISDWSSDLCSSYLLLVFWRLWLLANNFRARAAKSGNPESVALSLGFSVTVVSMALGNVYGSPFLEGSVMANFWILCGLIERYSALAVTGDSSRFVYGSEDRSDEHQSELQSLMRSSYAVF